MNAIQLVRKAINYANAGENYIAVGYEGDSEMVATSVESNATELASELEACGHGNLRFFTPSGDSLGWIVWIDQGTPEDTEDYICDYSDNKYVNEFINQISAD